MKRSRSDGREEVEVMAYDSAELLNWNPVGTLRPFCPQRSVGRELQAADLIGKIWWARRDSNPGPTD